MNQRFGTQRSLTETERHYLQSFFERDGRALRRFVESLTGCRSKADDIVSTVFETAAIRLVEGKSITTPLLFTIARRRVIDARRRQNTVDRYVRSSVGAFARCGIAEVEQSVDARSVLSGLAERERRALVYRYVFDLTVDQVASELGSSTKAAESLLGRARNHAARVA